MLVVCVLQCQREILTMTYSEMPQKLDKVLEVYFNGKNKKPQHLVFARIQNIRHIGYARERAELPRNGVRTEA